MLSDATQLLLNWALSVSIRREEGAFFEGVAMTRRLNGPKNIERWVEFCLQPFNMLHRQFGERSDVFYPPYIFASSEYIHRETRWQSWVATAMQVSCFHRRRWRYAWDCSACDGIKTDYKLAFKACALGGRLRVVPRVCPFRMSAQETLLLICVCSVRKRGRRSSWVWGVFCKANPNNVRFFIPMLAPHTLRTWWRGFGLVVPKMEPKICSAI